MKVVKLFVSSVSLVAFAGLFLAFLLAGSFCAGTVNAQTLDPDLRPDPQRAMVAHEDLGRKGRTNGYVPERAPQLAAIRSVSSSSIGGDGPAPRSAPHPSQSTAIIPSLTSISSGTPLNKILHTSQLSLTSSAGSDEQFVDRHGDLVADESTTVDSAGGSFDIAVGRSGARYEVYSATLNNRLGGGV